MKEAFTVLPRFLKSILTILVCLQAFQGWTQQDLYVDATASGANNGSNWANAYTKLSDAMNTARGGTAAINIHVAKGTYYPTGSQNEVVRDSAFVILRGGIRMYGGYPNGGGSRNTAANPVYLDGNINNITVSYDNSYHIMVIAGLAAGADSVIVDGFTFRNGNANGTTWKNYNGWDIWQNYGGALSLKRNSSGKILLRNCDIADNSSLTNAGAILAEMSDAAFDNCSFSNNSLSGGGKGGAMYNIQNSVSYVNCSFVSNQGGSGGALSNYNASVTISGSEFRLNISNRGGGIQTVGGTATIVNTRFTGNSVPVADGGGGIYQEGGYMNIQGAQFTNNSASYGGAIRNQGTPKLYVSGSVFSANTSTNTGAAVSLAEGIDTLVNNVFIRNKDNSTAGGGAINLFGGSFFVINNTFYADSTAGKGGAIRLEGSDGIAWIKNNIFYKCFAATDVNIHNQVEMLTFRSFNSFSIDPQFVNESAPAGPDNIWGTQDDGLVLNNLSSSVNSGDIIALLPPTDLVGNARVMGGAVDKGAYESGGLSHILYVDSTNGNDGNSGSSWSVPYKTLAYALQVANAAGSIVDSILIAKGTYFPTGQQNGTNRDSAFTILHGGIRMLGGYPAGGGVRDISSNPVYLDGNINDPADSLDNAYHVLAIVDLRGSSDSVVVDGVTIRNGNANGPGGKLYKDINLNQNRGGGVYLVHTGSPSLVRISNCNIANNTADRFAAGMYNNQSSPLISNCLFSVNNCIVDGGGIFNNDNSSPIIDKCIFSGNKAAYGAGLYNLLSSNPVIKNCSFTANKASAQAGAVMNNYNTTPLIDSCIFTGNSATYGAGVCNINNSSPAIRNSQFKQNTAVNNGAGIYNLAGCSPLIDSCVFAENIAFNAAGIYAENSAKPVIRNSRFLGNTVQGQGGAVFCQANAVPVLEKCEFTGNSARFGGAFYAQSISASITECRFDSNQAVEGGGAIFQRAGYMVINKSLFTKNRAQYGGAIRNDQSNALAVRNSVFELNTSTNTGAALSLYEGLDTLVNNIFIRNKDLSNVGGGAACVSRGNYYFINNTFYADSTNGKGGAIRLESAVGSARVFNNIFYKCYAAIADKEVHNAENLLLSVITNSHSIDPVFVNESDPDGPDNTWGTADDGLALAMCSPASNSGTNSLLDADLITVTDIADQPRIRLANVDQGAYESNRAFSLNEANATLTADANCGNNGWLNYYSASGEKLLLSIKPGSNALGAITATSKLRAGYGTNSTTLMDSPFGKPGNFFPFNRSWTITTTNAPVDSVGVRFYFGTADSSDVRNVVAFNQLKELILYKVNGTDAWDTDATGFTGYKYADSASRSTFSIGSFQGLQYAEFYVTSFSSGSMALAPVGTLPLDLLSFTGKMINQRTKLEWLTTNEMNLSGFEVERRSNDAWIRIGRLAAKNISGDHRYEIWDEQPASGMNYYRLKMIDTDGSFKYSKMIMVSVNLPSLEIYPNPNKGQFSVRIDNAARTAALKLFDASGKMVHQQQLVQGMNRVDVRSLSGGMYVLRIDNEWQSYSERLIIAK